MQPIALSPLGDASILNPAKLVLSMIPKILLLVEQIRS